MPCHSRRVVPLISNGNPGTLFNVDKTWPVATCLFTFSPVILRSQAERRGDAAGRADYFYLPLAFDRVLFIAVSRNTYRR